MKNSLSLGALVFAVAASCATQNGSRSIVTSVPATRRSIARRILSHTVRLNVYDDKELRKTASGVVVGTEATASGSYSYVVTNAHALDTAGLEHPRAMVVVEQSGQDDIEYAAQAVAMGHVPDMDLALLKIRGVALEPAVLAPDEELDPGEDVMVVAAPYGRAISLSGGMISQVEWDKDLKQPRMLKTDAPIGYGASGGGIYSRTTGDLLAIVEGYRTAKVGFAVAEKNYSFDVPMPGETFGAPTAKLRRFLKSHGFERFMDGRLAAGGEERAANR